MMRLLTATTNFFRMLNNSPVLVWRSSAYSMSPLTGGVNLVITECQDFSRF
ncbi:MAG: hypothetical protein HUU57_07760 [Bdellovibrio sp.]|nr:hypothetical protein [Bdellovibrio sp.]